MTVREDMLAVLERQRAASIADAPVSAETRIDRIGE